ncbi:MAG TPA: hypothetical protein VGO05_12940, partial [Roseiarcus sp.]|nr:hypothetical protein [Roseiarcus sp.]
MRIGGVGREDVADEDILLAERRPCRRHVAVDVDRFGQHLDRLVVLAEHAQRKAQLEADFGPIGVARHERFQNLLR